ncbi:MAG: hypothetical protein DRJ33_07245 [Candidatus Methanomethylicota archaeon]|uniref:Cyclophilin TM1367-like domain-containing protein n=1 Tax=Thermoproteota archaeon TaxID=2056631 RepID=A0A497EVD8_9CREN|nr:MAG: hypothetical protein DRJ33_07245 [Candidatus Verstraetearchaeota archaeon]
MRGGEEIYFSIPVSIGSENSRVTASKGDIAYWPKEPSLCIFF